MTDRKCPGQTGPRRRAARTLLGALAAALAAGGCSEDGTGTPVHVQVPAGAPFAVVADSLHAKGVVRSPRLFRIYARVTGADRSAQAGTYEFRPGAGWAAILEDLRLGRVATNRIAIPEGWELRSIAARLAAVAGLPVDSLAEALADPAYAERFGVPGPTLEGYLYPATYYLPMNVPLDTVIGHMVREYRRTWTPERRARADSMGMTEREVVTLASIVEKEARKRDEMPVIAGVFHNRLRIGYPLQADATVQYALRERRSRLFYAHIDEVADNPYNTYRHRGLPPGPIASPSVRAIDATLWPAETDYLYFVALPDGSHIFTRSLQEHNRARVRARREWDALEARRRAAEEAEGGSRQEDPAGTSDR